MKFLSLDNYYLSNLYERGLDEEKKKRFGIFYTPKYVIDYMVRSILKNHDFKSKPYLKILDLSCGCGNFLLEVYDILYEKFYFLKDELKIEDIHKHIVKNCLYGVDIDKNAINILKSSLKNKSIDSDFDEFNIYCFDSLNLNGLDENLKQTFFYGEFDYIIGNPPYIGHKNLESDYKKFLLNNYSEVYKDKSDIYFCFYKRIIDLLKKDGVASIITPRYFLESQSGSFIRDYIIKNIKIKEVIDFNGFNVFKNASIASCIFTMEKNSDYSSFNFFRFNNIDCRAASIKNIELFKNDEKFFTKININQCDLNENWIIDKKENIKLFNIIEKNCKFKLKDICVSFQGVITGCDKAFVLNKDDSKKENIEMDILRNWVKNKNINKYFIGDTNLKLIYSNDIVSEDDYLNSINHIKKYKNKLENRRECKKNIRKWYELQWGRDKSMFERKKIMHPYKSNENKFAIDENNSFCSADVYSFYIKKEYEKDFSYEYLVGILNSSVYDKYFKVFAKKMGKNLYDYYPNKVMDISIFKDENYLNIENLSRLIIKLSKFDDKFLKEINYLQSKIDVLIKNSLNINSLNH